MKNIVLQDLAMNREMFHVAEAELDEDDSDAGTIYIHIHKFIYFDLAVLI